MRGADDHLPRLPARLALSAERVDVVDVPLDPPADDLLALLDDDERGRASRFRFAGDRARFVAAHAMTRIAIGRATGCPPDALRFTAGPFGKPRLAESAIDVRFNLSHAGDRALLALTRGREVGIDIEEHRPLDVLDLAARFFAVDEIHALEALPASEREEAFYRCWTRKEAFIKALGLGLSLPLDCFSVSLASDEPFQALRTCHAAPALLHQWRIVALPVGSGYSAAVTAEAGAWAVRRWSLAGQRPADGVPAADDVAAPDRGD